MAQNFRTGRLPAFRFILLQLGTHRWAALPERLCRGRLGTALPRSIVLLPAPCAMVSLRSIRYALIRLLRPTFYLRLFSMAISWS